MEMPKLPSLLALPPELRNRIWFEVLTPPCDEPFSLENGHMEPGLLSVNRQIRAESSGIFYSNNILFFSDPGACIRRLTTMSREHLALLPELRYDTSETCSDPSFWREALQNRPGFDQHKKLEHLRGELLKKDVSLASGVLKCRVLIGSGPVWTSQPLAATFDANGKGMMLGRMMFF